MPIIGPFFVGLFTGMVGTYALDELVDNQYPAGGSPPPGPPPPPMPFQANQGTVQQISQTFLPAASEAIQTVKKADPASASSWKKMAAYLPGLTESVSMYYAMLDPKVPTVPKLAIAGSLLYFISPIDIIPDTVPVVDQLDDLGVLLSAFKYVHSYINPTHIAQAQNWLRGQGIDPTPPFYLGIDPGDVKQIPQKDFQPPAPPPKFS